MAENVKWHKDSYKGAVAVTPADSDLVDPVSAFYVGVTGDVQVLTNSGETTLFVAVPAGAIIPVACIQIMTTNTTATSIVGLK